MLPFLERHSFHRFPGLHRFHAHDGAVVVGWTALTRHHVREGFKHTAELSLYVKHSSRRKGVGSILAHAVLSRAPTLNLHSVLAVAFKDMPNVVSFAETKCGFSVAACLPDAFPDKETYYDILVFEKLIPIGQQLLLS